MTNYMEIPDKIERLAIYDETEGDRHGLIEVGLRTHVFFRDMESLFACTSVDWVELKDGLFLYGAGDSLAKGKSLNVPAMILTAACGRGQVVWGPVLIASVDGDHHISLKSVHREMILSVMKTMMALGLPGIYNQIVEIAALQRNPDSIVDALDSWMVPRTGIASFSGKDYR